MDPVELAGFEGGLAERFVPELMRGEVIEAHHLCRYLWASDLVPGKRVLDAGCGVAYGSAMMAEAGADSVVGVDVAESVVEASRSHVPEAVTLQCADLRSLPCDDGSFDVAVCFEVIEHVEEQERTIEELRRVLAPGAPLVVFEHNPYNPLTQIVVRRFELRDEIRMLRPHRTKRLLRESGLAEVDFGYILLFPSRRRRVLALERMLRRLPLGAQYYVAARPG